MFCKHCGSELFDGDRRCSQCDRPATFQLPKRSRPPNRTAIMFIALLLGVSLLTGIYLVWTGPQSPCRPKSEPSPAAEEPARNRKDLHIIVPVDESIPAQGSFSERFPLAGLENESVEDLVRRTFPEAPFNVSYDAKDKTAFKVTVTTTNGAILNLKGYFQGVPEGTSRPVLDVVK